MVIAGQHRLAAARKIAEEDADEGKQPPPYTVKFRCRELKAGTDLKTRETIAGLLQSRELIVHAMPLSERVSWMLREVEAQRAGAEKPEEVVIRKSVVLRSTYEKTACTESNDGSLVCVVSHVYKIRHDALENLFLCEYEIVSFMRNNAKISSLRMCTPSADDVEQGHVPGTGLDYYLWEGRPGPHPRPRGARAGLARDVQDHRVSLRARRLQRTHTGDEGQDEEGQREEDAG